MLRHIIIGRDTAFLVKGNMMDGKRERMLPLFFFMPLYFSKKTIPLQSLLSKVYLIHLEWYCVTV